MFTDYHSLYSMIVVDLLFPIKWHNVLQYYICDIHIQQRSENLKFNFKKIMTLERLLLCLKYSNYISIAIIVKPNYYQFIDSYDKD
jgi:hypothetical protein